MTLEFETRQKDLTHVLHRQVEQTVDSGRQ